MGNPHTPPLRMMYMRRDVYGSTAIHSGTPAQVYAIMEEVKKLEKPFRVFARCTKSF